MEYTSVIYYCGLAIELVGWTTLFQAIISTTWSMLHSPTADEVIPARRSLIPRPILQKPAGDLEQNPEAEKDAETKEDVKEGSEDVEDAAVMDLNAAELPILTGREVRRVRQQYQMLYTPQRLRRTLNPRSNMLERRREVATRQQMIGEQRRDEQLEELLKKRLAETTASLELLTSRLAEVRERQEARRAVQEQAPLPELGPRYSRIPYRG